jgi:hypothetical protein
LPGEKATTSTAALRLLIAAASILTVFGIAGTGLLELITTNGVALA